MGKLRNIQGLRALAVVAVVAYHLEPDLFPHGYLGVDVFLVISGFLIGKKLLSTPPYEKWPFRFVLSRIRRIWPSLALVSVFTLAIGWFLFDTSSYSSTFEAVLWSLAASSNFSMSETGSYFASPSLSSTLNHLWSISLEIQFYLFSALIYFLARKQHTVVKVSWAVLGSLSFLWSLFLVEENYLHAYHLLDSRFWEFAIGLTLAGFSKGAFPRVYRATSKQILFSQVAILSVTFFVFSNEEQWSPLNPILIVVLCLTVLEIVRENEKHSLDPWKVLENRALVAMGDWSYATYLWHLPLAVIFLYLFQDVDNAKLVVPALTISASYALAFLTTRYWEPIFTSGPNMSVFSLSVLASLVVVGVSLDSPNRISFGGVSFIDLESQVSVNRGLDDGCDRFFDSEVDACKSARTSTKETEELERVVLWGDSHAMHLAQGIVSSAPSGSQVFQFTRSLCAPIQTAAWTDGVRDKSWSALCMKHNQEVLDFLRRTPNVSNVVLGFSLYNFSSSNKYFTDAGELIEGPAAMAHLSGTLRELEQMNIKYRIVLSPPRSGANTGECLTRAKSLGLSLERCDFELDSSNREKLLEPLFDVADTHRILDLADHICKNDICYASKSGVFLYRDQGHLSKAGSLYLGSTYDWDYGLD